MNNYNSNSIGNSGHSQGLRAETLYTTSPDAVQRMHPHLQLRSGKAFADPVTHDHPWSSMRDFARLLALRYEALLTEYLIMPRSGHASVWLSNAKHARKTRPTSEHQTQTATTVPSTTPSPAKRTRRATKSIPSTNIEPTQNA